MLRSIVGVLLLMLLGVQASPQFSTCFYEHFVDVPVDICPPGLINHSLVVQSMNHTDLSLSPICRTWQIESDYDSYNSMEPGTQLRYQCTSSDSTVDCFERCFTNGTACNGNDDYCNRILPQNCTEDSVCFCTIAYYQEVKQCFIDSQWVVQTSESVPWSRIPKPYKPVNRGHKLFASVLDKKRAILDEVFIEFDSPKLTVILTDPNATFIWIQKMDLNMMANCTSVKCVITVPDNYFLSPGTLHVRVYKGSLLVGSDEFDVEVFTRCTVPNCIFCWAIVTSWDCYPTFTKYFIVIALVVLTLMALLSLPLLFKLVFSCCGMFFNCCKFSCTQCYTNGVQPAWQYVKPSASKIMINLASIAKNGDVTDEPIIDHKDEEMVEIESDSENDPKQRKKKISTTFKSSGSSVRTLHPWTIAVLCLIAVCVSPVMSSTCAEGVVLSDSLVTCSVLGTTKTCYLSSNALLTIPAVGTSSCVTFLDPDTGDIVGDLEITYQNAITQVGLQSLYFTSDWTGASSSNRQCPWESECSSSQQCSDFTANSQINPGGLLSGNSLQWPGRTDCSTSCGCAGCGCFSCDNACMYWRYAFVPKGEPWQVYAPHSARLRPEIKVTGILGNTTVDRTVELINTQTPLGNGFDIRIEGSLNQDMAIFGTRKIVAADTSAYLTEANNINAATPGGVGDIQANSAAQLFTPGTTSFIYPSNAVNVQIQTTSAAFHFPPQGIRSLPEEHKLPHSMGNILWDMSEGMLQGFNANPGTLLVSLYAANPVKIQKTVNVVCPKISSYTASGCYSCTQGSVIKVKAHSTCSSGHVSVTFSGAPVADSTVVLGTVQGAEVSIRVNPTKADVVGTLRLSSGTYSDEIAISFTAVKQDVIDTNRTDSDVSENNAPAGIDLMTDWFNSQDTWIQWLTGIAIAVGVIAAVVVLVWLIVKCGIFRRSKSYTRIPSSSATG